MCGIFGICDFSGRERVDETSLQGMFSVLKHRGPDRKSLFCQGPVTIGVCRLDVMSRHSTSELSHNEDSSVWAALDGEIYNYQDLRLLLEKRGHIFNSSSPEELITHLYEDFGHTCALKLNGVFSFALWDQNRQRLLLFRDRIGVKPLYYTMDEDKRLIFGSEIKAILEYPTVKRAVNIFGLQDYLAYMFVPAPQTMLEGIKKLLQGHCLVYDPSGCSILEYWDLSFQGVCGTNDYCKELYDLLKESIGRRLPDNRPVGLLLSGGIDSSAILALTSELVGGENVKTFSAGCEESTYDELPYARYVTQYFGAQNHEVIIKPDVLTLVEKLICHIDEPLADWSILPTYLVSRLAKKHVDIVLSGDAADDLFAGHERLMADRLDRYYRRIPHVLRDINYRVIQKVSDHPTQRGSLNVIKRFLEGSSLPPELRDCRWWTYLKPREEEKILNKKFVHMVQNRDPFKLVKESFQENDGPDLLSRELYVSLKYLSNGIVTKVEHMSMANSLQVRMPYLDYQFIDFSMRIPSNLKVRRNTTKWILKRSMANILPKAILRKGKRGFTIPMKLWLRNQWREKLEELLSEESIRNNQYINFGYVKKLISQHMEGRKDNSHKLWSLMIFVIWHSIYIDINSYRTYLSHD